MFSNKDLRKLIFPLFVEQFLLMFVGIADTFVVAILSEKWVPCIPYLRILTLVFLVRPFTTTCQQSILSVGRSDIILKIEIAVNAVAIGILFYSVFILESVIGIAIGTLIAEIVSMAMFMYYENKIIHYKTPILFLMIYQILISKYLKIVKAIII